MPNTRRDLVVHPVTPERWSDLAELFQRPGPRGGTPIPASCWCMWWREKTGDADGNQRAMRGLVDGGAEPGLLAYADGSPVGWVSVSPREDFTRLMRSRQYGPRDVDRGVFAIVCFYVDPRWKRRGVGSRLLDAAIEFARDRGAAALEAYPNVKPDYMGRRDAFESRGFAPARTAGTRTVLRLSL